MPASSCYGSGGDPELSEVGTDVEMGARGMISRVEDQVRGLDPSGTRPVEQPDSRMARSKAGASDLSDVVSPPEVDPLKNDVLGPIRRRIRPRGREGVN